MAFHDPRNEFIKLREGILSTFSKEDADVISKLLQAQYFLGNMSPKHEDSELFVREANIKLESIASKRKSK